MPPHPTTAFHGWTVVATDNLPESTPPRRRRPALRAAVGSAALVLATGGFAMWTFPTSVPVARTVTWLFGAEYLGRSGVEIQQNGEDCGITALQMVLEARGVPARTLDSARAAVLRRADGSSMEELKELAERRGVRAEGWHMDLRGLARAPLPAVVHLADHFAVVDRVYPDGRVEMRDPSLGRIRVSAEDFDDIWTGNVLLFPPPGTPSHRPALRRPPPAPAEAR